MKCFAATADVGAWNIVEDGKLYLSCTYDSDTLEYDLNGKILTIYVKGSVRSSYSFQKTK